MPHFIHHLPSKDSKVSLIVILIMFDCAWLPSYFLQKQIYHLKISQVNDIHPEIHVLNEIIDRNMESIGIPQKNSVWTSIDIHEYLNYPISHPKSPKIQS